MLHSHFTQLDGVSDSCDGLFAMSTGASGNQSQAEYTSVLTLNATTGLNGTKIKCTLNFVTVIGSDTIRVGSELILIFVQCQLLSFCVCAVSTLSVCVILQSSLLLPDHSQSLSPLNQSSLSVGVHSLIQWRVEWVGMCLV